MQEFSKQTKLRLWLIVLGSATLLLGAAYTIGQQSTRLSARDLPLATAQTAKHQLESGSAPADVVPTVKTDLSIDSTVFTTIVDNSSHVLASSAQLNGQTPLPPPGVFAYTQIHGSDHFTWEPVPGVRLATEVLHYGGGSNNGYVISGQSLALPESRIETFGLITIAAWLGVVGLTSLLIYWVPGVKFQPTQPAKARPTPTKAKPQPKKAQSKR